MSVLRMSQKHVWQDDDARRDLVGLVDGLSAIDTLVTAVPLAKVVKIPVSPPFTVASSS